MTTEVVFVEVSDEVILDIIEPYEGAADALKKPRNGWKFSKAGFNKICLAVYCFNR